MLDVIPFNEASLWFSGKEMQVAKKLCDFVGKNEKTKVIVKIQKVIILKLLLFLFIINLCVCVCIYRKEMDRQAENR